MSKVVRQIPLERKWDGYSPPYAMPPQTHWVNPRVNWQDSLFQILIQNKTGTAKFAVVNLEAGIGKSRETERIIVQHLKQTDSDQKLRFLIVKQFNEQVYECAENINKEFPHNSPALAVTSKEWMSFQSNPSKHIVPHDVVIITHARYIQLCWEEHLRNIFSESRHVLVIDEKVNFPTYCFNESSYKKAIDGLEGLLINRLSQLCTPLIAQLEILDLGFSSTHRLEIDNQLFDEVRKEVEHSIHSGKSEKYASNFQKSIKVLAATEAIYTRWDKSLRAYSPQEKYWGLDNNIILDANGALDYTYRVCNRFIIYEFPRLIDYSHSFIHQINCSSSNFSIKQNKEAYFQQMVSLFKARYSSDKKALFIVRQEHEQTLIKHLREQGYVNISTGDEYHNESDTTIVIDHSGNLLGKNKYSQFDQCWILGTFNLPISAYVLEWFRSSNNEFNSYAGTAKDWSSSTTKKTSRKFDDDDYEQMKKTHLIGDFYQTARRIQRKEQPKAEIFIAVKEEEVFQGVIKMMKGVNVGEVIEVSVSKQSKKSKETERMSATDRLVNFIVYYMDEGKRYSKKEIRSNPNVHIDEKNFARCLQDPRIRMMEEKGYIQIDSRSITKIDYIG